MREINIIAGPNGAGKTSFIFQHYLTGPSAIVDYVLLNADEIARELANQGTRQAVDLNAGRMLLLRLNAMIAERRNIVLETTLSGTNYLARIGGWKDAGYLVRLIYLRFGSVDQTIARVANRVAPRWA
jgi:predicted ABC-type ATPase